MSSLGEAAGGVIHPLVAGVNAHSRSPNQVRPINPAADNSEGR